MAAVGRQASAPVSAIGGRRVDATGRNSSRAGVFGRSAGVYFSGTVIGSAVLPVTLAASVLFTTIAFIVMLS